MQLIVFIKSPIFYAQAEPETVILVVRSFGIVKVVKGFQLLANFSHLCLPC